MCELCGGYVDVESAVIITDGDVRLEGRLCAGCRVGRQVCPECDLLLPAHARDCSEA